MSRHDHHDRLAGADHAADGVHGELVHDAVLGRPDLELLQLVLGGDLALRQLVEFRFVLAELLGDLAPHVLVDLQDLQLRLRRSRRRPGRRRRGAGRDLPVILGGLALDRAHAVGRDKLLVEGAQAVELAW